MKTLFCCDGSSASETAVRFGVQIVSACRSEVSILGIAEKPEDEDGLRRALRRVQSIFKNQDLDTELIVTVGRPVREIAKQTKEKDYDLVVIGAAPEDLFDKSLELVWMSVRVHEIVRSIDPPVLVVTRGNPELRRILVCTGGAAYIEKAIAFTGKIAQPVNAVVDLLYVLPEAPAIYEDLVRLEGIADRVIESNSRLGKALSHQKDLLEQLGVFGEIRQRKGRVVPEVLKELKQTQYDMVVSGSLPAKDRLRKYIMGDIAHEILKRVEIPVLIIQTGVKRHPLLRVKEFLGGLFQGREKTSAAVENSGNSVHGEAEKM